MLPFTREQFVSLFGAYNHAVWPVQLLAYLLGVVIIWMIARPSAIGNRIVAFGLALMWAWTGISYHWMFFSTRWRETSSRGMPSMNRFSELTT